MCLQFGREGEAPAELGCVSAGALLLRDHHMVIAELPPSALTVETNRDIAKTTTKKKITRSPLVQALLMVIRLSHLYFGSLHSRKMAIGSVVMRLWLKLSILNQLTSQRQLNFRGDGFCCGCTLPIHIRTRSTRDGFGQSWWISWHS